MLYEMITGQDFVFPEAGATPTTLVAGIDAGVAAFFAAWRPGGTLGESAALCPYWRARAESAAVAPPGGTLEENAALCPYWRARAESATAPGGTLEENAALCPYWRAQA